jgi:hypothetical protein
MLGPRDDSTFQSIQTLLRGQQALDSRLQDERITERSLYQLYRRTVSITEQPFIAYNSSAQVYASLPER